MGNSEKDRLRERKKRLKKQRRDYLRKEKESVKQQKREIGNIKRRSKKRARKKFSIKAYFAGLFDKKDHVREIKPKKKFSRRLKFWWEEKRSSRREKKELRRTIRSMRRKIAIDRRDFLIKSFLDFMKSPFGRKEHKDRDEKAYKQQIKEYLKVQRKSSAKRTPGVFKYRFRMATRRRNARFMNFISGLRESLSVFGSLLKNSQLRYDFLKTFINSVFLFILAFLVIYFLNKFFTILVARIFDIPAVLYSYRIFWPLYTYSSLYSRQALIVIFASGPVFSLVCGIIFYRIFLSIRRFRSNAKILFLWLAFHGFNMFFGAYVVGVITRTGFIYTTEWLFLSQVFDVEEIIFMIVSVITLIIFGFFATKQFILAANSPAIIEPRVRIYYMIIQVVLPWLSGFAILYLINYPNNPPELLLLYAVSALMIIPQLTNFNSTDKMMLRVHFIRNKFRPGWLYMLITIIILVLVRSYIFKGISFS